MSIVPDDMPHAVKALMRRFEKQLKPGSPGFALVVFDEDTGEPYHLIHTNRTGLAMAATGLMFETLELEKQGKCICPTCDQHSATVRLGLAAMGYDVDAPN